jgi:hypothetical protein
MSTQAPPRNPLTEDELTLVGLLRDFWTAFGELPQLHPADLDDASFHVQAISRIISMRATHRAHAERLASRAGVPIESFWQTQAPCRRP